MKEKRNPETAGFFIFENKISPVKTCFYQFGSLGCVPGFPILELEDEKNKRKEKVLDV